MQVLNYAKNMWNETLELFCAYFMKLNISENFMGELLHPTKQRL